MPALLHSAYHLGHAAATQAIHDLNERDPFWRDAGTYDRDDVRDLAHPGAFSEALDLLPQYDAPEISAEVDAGINAAYNAF